MNKYFATLTEGAIAALQAGRYREAKDFTDCLVDLESATGPITLSGQPIERFDLTKIKWVSEYRAICDGVSVHASELRTALARKALES